MCSVVGFASSDDYTTLDDLIEAVSSHDNESIVQCCDSGVFKAMDPEVTKYRLLCVTNVLK